MSLVVYDLLVESLNVLSLPFSGSKLHGLMCAFLCCGADSQGEKYLQTLIGEGNERKQVQLANIALFKVYALSSQQIKQFDCSFQLLLPSDEAKLSDRAQAFSEWCEGFVAGIEQAQLPVEKLDEYGQDAITHIKEFALLNHEELDMSEEDEKALFEINEYTRMAVLQISNELNSIEENVKH